MNFFTKRLKKLFSYSVYRKTLYAYAVSFLVLVILMLASTFTIMLSNIQDQSVESSQLLLTQLVSSAEKIKINVDDVMNLIMGDSATLRLQKIPAIIKLTITGCFRSSQIPK